MGPDDRIDNALRAIAQADASRGFPDQVRSRIEMGDAAPVVWWPRLVAATVMAVLGLSFVWMSRDDPAPPPLAAAVRTPTRAPSANTVIEGATDVASPAAVVSRRVSTTQMTSSDHERALQPLASLDPLDLPALAPAAMVVVGHAIEPLAPIAPLPVRALPVDTDGGEL